MSTRRPRHLRLRWHRIATTMLIAGIALMGGVLLLASPHRDATHRTSAGSRGAAEAPVNSAGSHRSMALPFFSFR